MTRPYLSSLSLFVHSSQNKYLDGMGAIPNYPFGKKQSSTDVHNAGARMRHQNTWPDAQTCAAYFSYIVQSKPSWTFWTVLTLPPCWQPWSRLIFSTKDTKQWQIAPSNLSLIDILLLASITFDGIVSWKAVYPSPSLTWSDLCSAVTNLVDVSIYGESNLSKDSLVWHTSNGYTGTTMFTTLAMGLHWSSMRNSQPRSTCFWKHNVAPSSVAIDITCWQILRSSGVGLH